MKTAVLISGQLRSFAQCLPTLHWHLFRKLDDPHFFVSCADDAQAQDAYLLEAYYKNVHIERVVQPTLPEPPARYAAHAPYAISVPIQSIMRQLWHLNRVWEFFREKNDFAQGYDQIIRCRPDLHMQRFELPPRAHVLSSGVSLTVPFSPTDAYTPWWGRYGGVNDRLAVMGSEAARAYFTAFTKLDEILKAGCPLHPETIQHEALAQAGCRISATLRADFITKRTPEDLARGKKDDWPVVLPQDTIDFIAATR